MKTKTKNEFPDNPNNFVGEVYFRVGRNLLLFQKIESRLKIITPYLRMENGETKLILPDSLERLLTESNSLRMLGALIKKLKLATPPAEDSTFHDYLTFILQERNKFIHDLENHPEFGIHFVNQCKASIQYLDRQHKVCSPLLTLADELSKTALGAMSILDESESDT